MVILTEVLKEIVESQETDYELVRDRRGWEIFFKGERIQVLFSKNTLPIIKVLSLKTRKDDVIRLFIESVSKFSSSEEKRLSQIKTLKDFLKNNKTFLNSIHRNRKINFHKMPVADFNESKISLGSGVLLHKSMTRNRRQSSEYKLIFVDGELAYARKSNHWGRFSTNIYEHDDDAPEGVEGDHFGRVGSRCFNWDLIGGKLDSAQSQAGYILIKSIKKG